MLVNCHVTRMNMSCYNLKWVMSHIWTGTCHTREMSHVTHTYMAFMWHTIDGANASCHIHECFMSSEMSRVEHMHRDMNESCHIHEMSHVTHTHGVHAAHHRWCECIMSPAWMCHATHVKWGSHIPHTHILNVVRNTLTPCLCIHTCGMTHSHMSHDSFVSATWLIHIKIVREARLQVRQDKKKCHVWNKSCHKYTWLQAACYKLSHVWQLSTRSHATCGHVYLWHVLFHMCDITCVTTYSERFMTVFGILWLSSESQGRWLNSFPYTLKRQQSSSTCLGGQVYHNSILFDGQHKKS